MLTWGYEIRRRWAQEQLRELRDSKRQKNFNPNDYPNGRFFIYFFSLDKRISIGSRVISRQSRKTRQRCFREPCREPWLEGARSVVEPHYCVLQHILNELGRGGAQL